MQIAVVSEVKTELPRKAIATWDDPAGWAFSDAHDPRSRIPSNTTVANFISISIRFG
jgi:hypothetical protein